MRGSVITRTDETVGQSYRDLREWLELVDQMGELRVINGADWNLEIAAITELARMESKEQPALLFDQIKDHPAGYRVLSGMNNTIRRLALSTAMPPVTTVEEFYGSSWGSARAPRPAVRARAAPGSRDRPASHRARRRVGRRCAAPRSRRCTRADRRPAQPRATANAPRAEGQGGCRAARLPSRPTVPERLRASIHAGASAEAPRWATTSRLPGSISGFTTRAHSPPRVSARTRFLIATCQTSGWPGRSARR